MRAEKLKKKLILSIPYIVIGAIATNIGEAWRLASGSDLSGKLQGMVTGGALGRAFNNPMPSMNITDILTGAAIGTIIRLAVYIKSKNRKNYRHNIEYGSARWGKHEDIEPFEDPEFKNNVLLSQTERITMNSRPSNPKYARNKNVLVVGGSGSGKTRFFIKPQLLQMHSSYVVTDPKGYLWIGQ
jgi:type IV secretion system protein VirD4